MSSAATTPRRFKIEALEDRIAPSWWWMPAMQQGQGQGFGHHGHHPHPIFPFQGQFQSQMQMQMQSQSQFQSLFLSIRVNNGMFTASGVA